MPMRLFAAIRLPADALPAVLEAAKPLQNALGARALPAESLHLTLKFIGEADAAKAKEIETALSAIRFPPFSVSLSGAGAFPSERVPRAIWIGGKSEGAEKLAAKVGEALSFLKLPEEKFAVHLTVARSKGIADLEDFLKTGEVCSFDVHSFSLMKSTLTPAGACYEVLREFPAEGV